MQKINIGGMEQVVVQAPEEYFTADNQLAVRPVNLTEQQRQKLTTLLAASDYLALSKMSDGQYVVRAKLRLPGGGPIGAAIGTALGFGLTYGAAELVIGAISLGAGAVGGQVGFGAMHTTLWKMAGPTVAKCSMKAAATLGVAGGVMTGPV